MKHLVLVAVVMMAGCGGTKLGPGTLTKANSDGFEYRQDNNWVYSNGRSQIRASSMAGQHCDSLTLYEDVSYAEKIIGVNCHEISSSGSFDFSAPTGPAGWCITSSTTGYLYAKCP